MYKIALFVFALVCALAFAHADDLTAEDSAYVPVHAYSKYPAYYSAPSYEFAYGFRAHDAYPHYYKGGYGYGHPHYGYAPAIKAYHY